MNEGCFMGFIHGILMFHRKCRYDQRRRTTAAFREKGRLKDRGGGVSCSAFPRNWCWRVFIGTGTIPSSSGGIDPRGKIGAPGDERRREMEGAIRRQAEWSSAPRSNSVPRDGRLRARGVRVRRRRDEVLGGQGEFPKNSINFNKFTGFFDKLMKRIFPVNGCNVLSYVIHTNLAHSDVAIKKFFAASAFSRNCPHLRATRIGPRLAGLRPPGPPREELAVLGRERRFAPVEAGGVGGPLHLPRRPFVLIRQMVQRANPGSPRRLSVDERRAVGPGFIERAAHLGQ